MKKTLFALMASFVASAAFAQEPTTPVQVGRYQMIDATVSGTPDSEKAFKRLAVLDTATGMISICDYVYQDAGKQNDKREYWWANGRCSPFQMQNAVLMPKVPKVEKK